MFTTQQGQELDLSPMIAKSNRHWLMVEHDLGVPWFHVAVLQRRGQSAPRTFLLGDSGVLQDFLISLDEHFLSYAVQVVLPAMHPDNPYWVMQPVVRIESASNKDGQSVDIYFFDDGSSFEFIKSGGSGEVLATDIEVIFEKKGL